MRRFVVVACICWLSLCSADEVPNYYPLAFGMTPQQTAVALGLPLNPVAERRRDEIYVADSSANIPGLYSVGKHLYLKFHDGRLTGWKYDWRLRPHFPF